MMPFSLGVCLGHRPLAFVVTSHIIECTPATSWHVYTSHKLASVYTSHEGECGATCQKMAGGHCPSLFRYSTPLKPPSVFSNRIPYSNKPSVCAQNSLVIFKKAPTPRPPPPPHRAPAALSHRRGHGNAHCSVSRPNFRVLFRCEHKGRSWQPFYVIGCRFWCSCSPSPPLWLNHPTPLGLQRPSGPQRCPKPPPPPTKTCQPHPLTPPPPLGHVSPPLPLHQLIACPPAPSNSLNAALLTLPPDHRCPHTHPLHAKTCQPHPLTPPPPSGHVSPPPPPPTSP